MDSPLPLETRKIFSVTEVTRDIRSLLEDSFPSVWISGEISNFKKAASGHCYFTLKDEGAQLTAVMFRGSHRLIRFEMEDGLEIIAHGKITVYEGRGQHQIIVEYVEPKGLGALQLAFEQLKKRLDEEGLFDQKYKKPIPFLPRKIGIVTSSKGAALQDMLSILRRRFPNIDILIHPVKVQGQGSAEEVAAAIAMLNRCPGVDVMIVGRGGGSMEDLWAFNEEVVVRAIFKSEIPVISAVGHETDFTLADLVADLRAPTPSAAAELAIPERDDLTLTVQQHQAGLRYALRQYLKALHEKISFLKRQLKDPQRVAQEYRQRLDDMSFRLVQAQRNLLKEKNHRFREMVLRRPDLKRTVEEKRFRLKELTARLMPAIQQHTLIARHAIQQTTLRPALLSSALEMKRLRFVALRDQLKALSPEGLLERGFSLVFREGETRPLNSMENLLDGEVLEVRLFKGKLKVRILESNH